MVKRIFLKEMILLDFHNDKYRFYNIEIHRLSYNELQVVFHSGKLGTKGTQTIKNTTSYEQAMALAYKRFYEKKVKNFQEKEDLIGWLGQNNSSDSHSIEKSRAKNKHSKPHKSKDSSCDLCHNSIKADIYDEINKWGRGGGGWDKDKNSITYKKVLCIDCQFKHGIFKKRL
ncbi:WGR domain-containing protein [Priestia filamentosa]|uniref:WGR domain-containing protein n=1 Tax=Priestia filamentosa TaxID=1402861 RepID=UPI00397A8BFD